MDYSIKSARAALDRVISTVERSVTSLSAHVTPEGRLDEGDQAAVRLLRSRIRFLNRLWTSVHGQGWEKSQADLELRLSDIGALIQIGEKMHGAGRLDCRACDTVTLDGAEYENPARFPVCGARLCEHCNAGVQHLYTVRREITTEGGTLPLTPPLGNAPTTRYEPDDGRKYLVEQIWACDRCKVADARAHYTETETGTPEGRLREFRL